MSEMQSRPRGRFFCGWDTQLMVWLLAMALSWMMWLAAVMTADIAHAQGAPTTTLINDTVYRADGTPAGGVLLISWGPFTTAAGKPIAAGNLSATLGTGGTLNVSLVPNAGATPASMYYEVVYQLDDGAVDCFNASSWSHAK